MKTVIRNVCVAVVVTALGSAAMADLPSFQGLGDLPGGEIYSWAYDVSADGSAVVGHSKSSSGTEANEAFLWTVDGMTGMGNLSGVGYSNASAVSWDESAEEWVVAGTGNLLSSSGTSGEAFRTVGNAVDIAIGPNDGLGMVTGGTTYSGASGLSADGTVVVGQSDTSGMSHAFRWTESTGMVDLDDLPGGISFSCAHDISADGSVVVGWGTGADGREAIRWTEATGMIGLGDLEGGSFASTAYNISADGSVIVGYGTSASGTEAFYYTEGDGMVGLGDLPGGGFESYATDASVDGSVIVGIGSSPMGREAFIWDAVNGMRNLRDMLVDYCDLDLTGWTLSEGLGISDDGLTIIGSGINPNGDTEGWIIMDVPEPATMTLLALGGIAVLRRRRKQ